MKMIVGSVLLFVSSLAATGKPAAGHAQTSPYPFEVCVREVWSTFGDPGFGWPRGMLQWPDGTVWVGDSQVSEVAEVAADGTNVKRVLRAGEGPGELRRVYYIVPYRDGGIVIHESPGFSFFGADKKFRRRMMWPVNLETQGLVATPDGDLIASGGFGHETHELARYAVHRFDSRRGRHVKSWHAAADHQQPETVRYTSGGPMVVTSDGGLLVSDAAPFRVTRYADLMGNGAQLVIEDEDVVSASELDRAVTYGNNNSNKYTTAWTRSFFIDELENGDILNIVRVSPEDDAPPTSEWLVISPEGSILARTPVAKGYDVWNATPDGHYLATYWDDAASMDAAVKLEVVVGPPPCG